MVPLLASVISPTILPRVLNVIEAQSWSLPDYVGDLFPYVVQQILRLPLPLNVEDDKLIWEPTSTGKIFLSSGCHIIRQKHTDCAWAKVIRLYFFSALTIYFGLAHFS